MFWGGEGGGGRRGVLGQGRGRGRQLNMEEAGLLGAGWRLLAAGGRAD